jgi:hypothetical protein
MLGEVALDLATFVFFAVLVPAALYGLWLISCDLFDRWWWHR